MEEEWTTVSVRTFQGAVDLKRRELIPEEPGLYLWTHDLQPLIGAQELLVQRCLREVLAFVGRDRTRAIQPYQSVTIRDKRMAISDAKRLLLHEAFESGDGFGAWLARMTTHFQRPLYAGMTLDLFKRTGEHLTQGSTLRKRLEGAGADLLDLAVTWAAAPVPETPDDEEPDMDALDQRLKAAESLLIRLTMPMFNEKQD